MEQPLDGNLDGAVGHGLLADDICARILFVGDLEHFDFTRPVFTEDPPPDCWVKSGTVDLIAKRAPFTGRRVVCATIGRDLTSDVLIAEGWDEVGNCHAVIRGTENDRGTMDFSIELLSHRLTRSVVVPGQVYSADNRIWTLSDRNPISLLLPIGRVALNLTHLVFHDLSSPERKIYRNYEQVHIPGCPYPQLVRSRLDHRCYAVRTLDSRNGGVISAEKEIRTMISASGCKGLPRLADHFFNKDQTYDLLYECDPAARLLYDLVGAPHRLSEKLTKYLIRQLLQGIGALHQWGLVHGELSMQTIVVSRHGQLRIQFHNPLYWNERLAVPTNVSSAGSILSAASWSPAPNKLDPIVDIDRAGTICWACWSVTPYELFTRMCQLGRDQEGNQIFLSDEALSFVRQCVALPVFLSAQRALEHPWFMPNLRDEYPAGGPLVC